MTTYRRRGHWRRGRNGELHWVNGHSVTRTGSGWSWRSTPLRAHRPPTPASPPPVLWRQVPTAPNATCPVCGARVWFFRDRRGGCAWFDALGAPWPKHPCMDRPGGHGAAAAAQAQRAYEQARVRAAKRAHRVAVGEDRRRRRTATKAATAALKGAPRAVAEDAQGASARKRRLLGWWTALAMLLAWLGSVPLTVAIYADRGGSDPWGTHLIVGMPTVVSLAALAWFLIEVPAPRATVRRVLGAVLLAPLFLVVGTLLFLFTAGLGSLAFAWFLWWQGRRPAAPASAPQRG